MKKSILAIFLAVIAMAQVHAQDSDLRSAPDLPTFKVTLNYSSANTDRDHNQYSSHRFQGGI